MKQISSFILIATSLLVLEACKFSKDIATPTDAAPAAYRDAENTDTTTIATIPWNQYFTDPALQQLISQTIARNVDMQLAVKNIEATQLLLKQSKLGYWPEVNLQANAAISRPSDNSLNGISLSQFLGKSYIENYTLSASVSWEADIWGKIKSRKDAAQAAYLQTIEARKAIQTELVSAVAKGYYNLLMLDEQLGIARSNLQLSDSTVNIIQLQYKAGDVTALGVQQSAAQKLVAMQLIPQIEQEIILQENALSVLAGIPPSAIARNSRATFNTDLASGVPASLLENRPDIKAKELALRRANADVHITRANMYPSLSITAEGGINSFLASNWFSLPASLFTAAAGSLVQPVFNRGKLRTAFEVSQVEREKTLIDFRQSVLDAVGEVSDALAKTSKLEEQKSVAAERVQTLQQAIGNSNLLFKSGMANYLEVITAQSNVLQAELELAVLNNQQLAARVELYRALGGGWQ